jgi:D-alanyl-D-alanine carboxypeptidase
MLFLKLAAFLRDRSPMTHSFRLSFRLAAGAACAAATLALAPAAWADRYAAIVVDASTNEVLHADQADSIRYPASLTKMMTLYMLFEAMEQGEIRLNDTIEASRRAQNQPPSRLGLRAGDRITVEQAIGALVTKSANDVAVAVAERLEGSEARFAQRMTAKARQLGMRDTRYVNASGLPDPNQITTARDVLALSQALLRDYPQNYRYFQTAEFSWRNVYARNHNGLLGRVEGVDGIKTGYTRMSGFNLASSAQRNGHRIFAVVMGGESAASRDAQMAYLIDTAFQQIDAKTGGRPVRWGTRATVTPPPAATSEPEDMAEVAVAANGAAIGVTVEQGSADQPSYVVPVPFAVRPVAAAPAGGGDVQIRGSTQTDSTSGAAGGRE